METYPIRMYGRQTGTLQVCQEGMYTVFRATSECGGEMIRLWAFGGGKSGYLGVMVPDGSGSATLTRRLSKSAMCDFPDPIEYAGVEERSSMDCDCCDCESCCCEEEPSPEPEEPRECFEQQEPTCPENPPCDFEEEPECEMEDDILWYACPDGTLTTFDGVRNLIALPAEEVQVPKGAEGTIRWIDGKKYMIFPE